MTDPSQYFKGRTVQEQMDEVIGYVDVRSAEVATAAIASDVAQVHQDMLDADADATAAAASAAAAAGTLANAVKKTGEASQSIAGDIAVAGDLSGGTVTVPTPVNNTDAASKKYVDDADALKLNITDINSYAVGLTGNQLNIAGTKTFTGAIISNRGASHFTAKDPGNTIAGGDTFTRNIIICTDGDDVEIATLRVMLSANGVGKLDIRVRNADGTYKTLILGEGNP